MVLRYDGHIQNIYIWAMLVLWLHFLKSLFVLSRINDCSLMQLTTHPSLTQLQTLPLTFKLSFQHSCTHQTPLSVFKLSSWIPSPVLILTGCFLGRRFCSRISSTVMGILCLFSVLLTTCSLLRNESWKPVLLDPEYLRIFLLEPPLGNLSMVRSQGYYFSSEAWRHRSSVFWFSVFLWKAWVILIASPLEETWVISGSLEDFLFIPGTLKFYSDES